MLIASEQVKVFDLLMAKGCAYNVDLCGTGVHELNVKFAYKIILFWTRIILSTLGCILICFDKGYIFLKIFNIWMFDENF